MTKKVCRGQHGRCFPTTLEGFFSRFPGLRHFLGIKIALFSTAVDASDMRDALSSIRNEIYEYKV